MGTVIFQVVFSISVFFHSYLIAMTRMQWPIITVLLFQ